MQAKCVLINSIKLWWNVSTKGDLVDIKPIDDEHHEFDDITLFDKRFVKVDSKKGKEEFLKDVFSQLTFSTIINPKFLTNRKFDKVSIPFLALVAFIDHENGEFDKENRFFLFLGENGEIKVKKVEIEHEIAEYEFTLRQIELERFDYEEAFANRMLLGENLSQAALN